jgi:hypothetical protein
MGIVTLHDKGYFRSVSLLQVLYQENGGERDEGQKDPSASSKTNKSVEACF